MNDSLGLIIFAIIALGAVFAFIIVLGGTPPTTGDLSAEQKIATSWYKYADQAARACARQTCHDGLVAIPTGNYDEQRRLYECKCQTNLHDNGFLMYRSGYTPG